jgi:molecular chaperone DnaK (HSP70)
MKDIIIGIDLGTTNSEVALVKDGKVEVLEIKKGTRQLPSYIGFDNQGDLLIGEAARNQYLIFPERTIKSVKRHMGEDTQLLLADKQYTPQELSAMILRHLKQVAEKQTGQTIRRAVITVPAFFSDAQRQATRDAGEIAGLTVERIINEPTAAALAYEVDSPRARTILVYDLGGGTFDVSVVKIERDVVEVLSSHGDNQLGGDDFDEKIIAHILQHLEKETDLDVTTDARAMSRITRAAEEAKIALSTQPYYTIEEEHLLEKQGSPVHLSLELAREEYEEMIAPFIDQTMQAVHTALDGAGLRVADMDEILLVGGSTKTPVVRNRLEQDLGLQVRLDVDPDLCVASGAAIQAGMIAGETVSAVLVDVTPYTFGTSALGELNGSFYPECFIPIIKKNTPIPVTRSESFFATHDGQNKVKVSVYQGENEDALENKAMGDFMIEGLKNVKEGDAIISTFSLDINGILHVTGMEKKTGKKESLRIDNAISRFQEEELEQAKQHIDTLFSDEDSSDSSSDQVAATQVPDPALLEKARNLRDSLEGDDKEDIDEVIEDLEQAITANDASKIQQASEELTDLIYYLET